MTVVSYLISGYHQEEDSVVCFVLSPDSQVSDSQIEYIMLYARQGDATNISGP